MENASGAFLDAVRKSMRQIRTAMGAAVIDPSLLTFAEKLQYEGYLRREETNAAILSLSEQGIGIKEIVRRTGYSRGLIRKIFRGQRSDVFRIRPSSLEPYFPGSTSNGPPAVETARLFGGRSVAGISRLPWRRERMERTTQKQRRRIPPRWPRTIGPHRRASPDGRTGTAFKGRDDHRRRDRERGRRSRGGARDHSGVPGHHSPKGACRTGRLAQQSAASLVAAFANGVSKDRAAIQAAIALSWSNGQTEGQICKLKLVKRQMYGRGNLDLLQARVIGLGWAAPSSKLRQSQKLHAD